MIKKIGVLTSGGDAPGMNAAIRAVTRTAIQNGLEVYGIHDGYLGMYEGRIERLYRKSVSEKMGHGGTFLGTARLNEFTEREVRVAAIANLEQYGIDALVCIGGDGTYQGALALSQMGVPCVCLPGTIDNDIAGTDFTIGFDTALNTVVEAVDKLRDTSNSHRRCSIIEVMGRNCGDLAVWTAIAVGAEVCIAKETGFDLGDILENVSKAAQSKRHAIIIVAENMVKIEELAMQVTLNTPFEARA
ncbi:MAG TPA: ATP-dependent 6-phosphofructokinase, partial [Bacilli bacterium]|nr:ATP-dependent 6-phosphofructokinase [Bacilli bacterium]